MDVSVFNVNALRFSSYDARGYSIVTIQILEKDTQHTITLFTDKVIKVNGIDIPVKDLGNLMNSLSGGEK